MSIFAVLMVFAGTGNIGHTQGTPKPSPVQVAEDDWADDVQEQVREIEDIRPKIEDPGTPPEDKAKYEAAREAAVSNIEAVGQKRPENFKAQMAVGKALLDVSEPGRALPFADQAVTLSQDKPKQEAAARTLRGTILQGQGDYPAAARECGRAMELDPRNATAFSCFQLTSGRTASNASVAPVGAGAGPGRPPPAPAPDAVEQAAVVAGLTDGAALKAAGLVETGATKLKLGDAHGALRLGERAAAADPRSARALVIQSQAQHALKRYAEALKAAEAAAGLDPMSAAALWARAKARESLGHPWEAIRQDMEKAARLDPSLMSAFEQEAARHGAPGSTSGTSGDARGAAESGSQAAARTSGGSPAKNILSGALNAQSWGKRKYLLALIGSVGLCLVIMAGFWIVWRRKTAE
ncbi:MAG: hypothetical protein HZB91_13330 [Elusimicrobia bacterium]|nr:hypothetical protein [Elusimicrobiota bacterium]